LSYAFDDAAKHLVLASCYEGLGYLLIFEVNPNPFPVKPKAQSPLEEACDDGLTLSICPESSPLRIYAKSERNKFKRVYKANETHMWKSKQTILDERDNIKFFKSYQKKDGTAQIIFEVPMSLIKVEFNMITHKAAFLQKSNQEHIREVDG
jgi:hypothetical protein